MEIPEVFALSDRIRRSGGREAAGPGPGAERKAGLDLNIPTITPYGWLRRGWLKGRHINGQWAIAADRREGQRLRNIRREHPPLNRPH